MALSMNERIRHIKFGSLQPDIESLLKLTPEDFSPADYESENAAGTVKNGSSNSKRVWNRFKQNKAAITALAVLIFIIIFAFLGPSFVPYAYDEFVAGAENLYPYHYSIEDQAILDKALGDRDARLQAELEKSEKEKGAELSSIEIAVIKAEVSQNAADVKEIKKANNIHLKPFGYSNEELKRIQSGEKVFPHVFGTDKYGRDIMVRLMIGTRVSLLVGIFAALLVLVIGAVYGSISGFAGGRVDEVMMRLVELIYATPEMLVVLLLSTAFKPALVIYQSSGNGFFQSLVGLAGPNLISLFVAFGLLYWVPMARVIRGQILQLKEQEFVTAAKALGASSGRIILRHLLPNCIGQIIVTTCLQIPAAIFLESFMSYLGVGVTAPMTSLGSMASDALSGIETYGYRLVIPALLLSIIILVLNLLGDGLRDALDPRLK
jgi:oligopeptide transport system permease protein